MQLGDGRCGDAKQPSITQTSASSNRSLEKVLIASAPTISPKVDDFIRSFQPINCLLFLSSPQALCRTPFPRVGKPGCSPQCKPQELTGLLFPSPFLLHFLLWKAIFSDFLLLFNLTHQHVTSSSRVLGLVTKTRRKHWRVSWKLKKKVYRWVQVWKCFNETQLIAEGCIRDYFATDTTVHTVIKMMARPCFKWILCPVGTPHSCVSLTTSFGHGPRERKYKINVISIWYLEALLFPYFFSFCFDV